MYGALYGIGWIYMQSRGCIIFFSPSFKAATLVDGVILMRIMILAKAGSGQVVKECERKSELIS